VDGGHQVHCRLSLDFSYCAFGLPLTQEPHSKEPHSNLALQRCALIMSSQFVSVRERRLKGRDQLTAQRLSDKWWTGWRFLLKTQESWPDECPQIRGQYGCIFAGECRPLCGAA
jgi:hypothetical protein